MEHLVFGDIGGTNSRLSLCSSPDGASSAFSSFTETFTKVYDSRKFDTLGELIVTFLDDANFSGVVGGACVAVCGPVANEDKMVGPVLKEQHPTTWGACATDLTTGALLGRIKKACLINDFIAVGLGLTELADDDVEVLHPGQPQPRAPICCVGAGTGLGEVFLTWQSDDSTPTGGHYNAWCSEGGMTEFFAHTDQEWELRKWIIARDGHSTVEHVVSGPGLANTYRFLCESKGVDGVIEVPDGELQKAVAEKALAKTDPICEEALAIMLKAWGGECRSAALRTMCYGGMYLAGGLTPKLLPGIKEHLVESYKHGDPLMGDLIRQFPLIACKNDSVGMVGAKVRAFRLL